MGVDGDEDGPPGPAFRLSTGGAAIMRSDGLGQAEDRARGAARFRSSVTGVTGSSAPRLELAGQNSTNVRPRRLKFLAGASDENLMAQFPHRLRRASGEGSAAPAGSAHTHLVEQGESFGRVAAPAALFLHDGLTRGANAMVLATPDHQRELLGALLEAGTDIEGSQGEGRLTLHDAGEAVDRFMVAGMPDASRFRAVMSELLAALPPSPLPPLVYGELVSLLWHRGAIAAAIELEDLWNGLAAEREVAVFCAYPLSSIDRADPAGWVGRIGELMPVEPRPSRRSLDTLARRLTDRFTAALRDSDAPLAADVLEEGTDAGIAAATLLARVVTPAMHEIGRLGQAGELTVADQHLATAVCHRALAVFYPQILTARPRSRERIVVAAVEGEPHGLAPRIIADVLEGNGYEVIHLGSDVPVEALAQSVERYDPAIVALSVTMPDRDDALERTILAIEQVRPQTLFMLGGQGIGARWRRAGFPVAYSAEEAVGTAERLVNERPRMPQLTVGRLPLDRADEAPTATPDRYGEMASELADLARAHALRAHEYHYLALEDPLTGLPNRRAFDDRFGQIVARAERTILLVVDIDDFKTINDVYGHEAGDRLLAEVGRAIIAALRPGDLVARLGGDEFGVLLRGDGPEAPAIAERVRAGVRERCRRMRVTVSVGGAAFTGDARLTALEADRALYMAKSQGRNAVALSLEPVAGRSERS